MREYILRDPPFGNLKIKVPDKCCLFCSHCSDIFWDYSHGPYMKICELNIGAEDWMCDQYEEESDDN